MGKLLNHSVCFEIFRPCTTFMGYSTMRKRVLEIIEIGVENDTLSKIYDVSFRPNGNNRSSCYSAIVVFAEQ